MKIEDPDFDAAVERLRGRGYKPEVVSFDDDGHGRALYLTDPDGNVVEFWTWDVQSYMSAD